MAPWMLAAVNSCIPIGPRLARSLRAAALVEPLAAALNGVAATPLRPGDRMLVLGARKLGLMVVAAAAAHRRMHPTTHFTLVAAVRNERAGQLALKLGADAVVDVATSPPPAADIVFDTTGSPAGFSAALQCASRFVHLKSTHGQPAEGVNHLTEMVVDEIALVPLVGSQQAAWDRALEFSWPKESCKRDNSLILTIGNLSPAVEEWLKGLRRTVIQVSNLTPAVAEQLDLPQLRSASAAPFPGFDLAVVGTLADIDRVLRPYPNRQDSILRPRGAILIDVAALSRALASSSGNALTHAFSRGVSILSSRCGDFRPALELLDGIPELADLLDEAMVTATFPVAQVAEAFRAAAEPKHIKVLVDLRLSSNPVDEERETKRARTSM
eukprot:TRINITY_DN3049_c0_g1_i2.p1 TRINITY_DN3049_c0_g1~~TRINITY_DN3049_c0_g1_i2.p1  ORF type:complete len:384 (-),score=86.29 TRINITY_DN3049_c0_g1_i2:19-1170(-)